MKNNYDVINISVPFHMAYDLYDKGVAIELVCYDDEQGDISLVVHYDNDTDISFLDIVNRFFSDYGVDYIEEINYTIEAKGEY